MNLEFDGVYRSLLERLRKFTTEDVCGRWNSTLLGDLNSDSDLLRASEQLHIEAGRHCGQSVSSDGLSIKGVQINFNVSMHVDFRFDSLSGNGGYSSAPGRFSIELNPAVGNPIFASFGCGLRKPYGDFWYPAANQQQQTVSLDYDRWAYVQTKTYGGRTLSSWIANRSTKSK